MTSAAPRRAAVPSARRPAEHAAAERLPGSVTPSGPVEPWPAGVSREATMRISDVLADLSGDFPTVTPSKLRFLEEQGLVEPRRTPGGYRQYSPADVERLRYVLRQQRDRYLPLKVIGEQLAALDSGRQEESLVPRLATQDGERTGRRPSRPTVESLADGAGTTTAFVEELVEAGVLHLDGGPGDTWAAEVVATAAALSEHGIDVRHLRSFRSAADRQVSVVEQVVAPVRGQRAPSAQTRAASMAAEVGELCGRMHTALVRAGVARLAP